MPTLFLSYRRADSIETTGRIYDRLIECFGAQSVFRDIDTIPVGVPFPDFLRQTLARTDAVLVIVGPIWLSVADERGEPRLENPADFVRMEVETALALDAPVVPVVVANAAMPMAHQLPESLRALAERNGMAVRPDPDFHRDMDRLCGKLQQLLGIPDAEIRRSEILDGKVRELTSTNERLQAALEIQNELATLDHAWDREREKYKVQYGKNSAPQDPTLEGTVLVTVGASIAAVVVLITISRFPGGFLPALFKVIWVLVGIFLPICHFLVAGHKYIKHKEYYKKYQQCRKDVVGRLDASLNREIRWLDGERSQSVTKLGAEATEPVERCPFDDEFSGDAREAPPLVAKSFKAPAKPRRMRGLIATLLWLVLIVGVLRVGFWLGTVGEVRQSARPPEVVGSPPALELIPENERSSAPALVKHLASGDQKTQVEASRRLEDRPDLAEEAVPLLCERFEASASSDSPESIDLRRRILILFAKYGPAAKGAAPAIIRTFGLIASRVTDESGVEIEEILRTLERISPDPPVTAEMRAALAAAGAGRPGLAVARLIVATHGQAPIDDEDLVGVVKVVGACVREAIDRVEIPKRHLVDVLEWSVERSTRAVAPSAPLLDTLVELNRSLQGGAPVWGSALQRLGESAPARTRTGSHWVGRRFQSYSTMNPQWISHEAEIQAARGRIEHCAEASRAIADAVKKGTMPGRK